MHTANVQATDIAMNYHAPTRDHEFALNEVCGLDAVLALEKFKDFDRETISAVLRGAGQFAEGVLAPLNRSGDVEGAQFENGRVFAARGFADAYRQFASGGWNGLTADPEY